MIDVPMRPGSSSRCRVWFGELPDATYEASDEIIFQVAAQPSVLSAAKSVAMELWIATGPRQHYGLLGGTFQPQASEEFVVRIAVSEVSGETWDRPFGMKNDFCVKGLPREYAKGVEESIRSKAPLGAGILWINFAAHEEASSSPNMFRQLAKLLLSLLVLPEPPPMDVLTELAIGWAKV